MKDFDKIRVNRKPEVPAGFFEEFPDKVLKDLSSGQRNNPGTKWSSVATFSAIAASLLLFVWIGGISDETSDSEFSSDDVANNSVVEVAEVDSPYDDFTVVELGNSLESVILAETNESLLEVNDAIELTDFVSVLDEDDLDIDWYADI